MANQTDRLARIAAEGFAMIDELYGRPRRPSRNPHGQKQGPQPPYQGNQVPRMAEPLGSQEVAQKIWLPAGKQFPRMAEPLSSQEVAKRYGGIIDKKTQQDGY